MRCLGVAGRYEANFRLVMVSYVVGRMRYDDLNPRHTERWDVMKINSKKKWITVALMILAGGFLTGADVDCDLEDGEFEIEGLSWPRLYDDSYYEEVYYEDYYYEDYYYDDGYGCCWW